jgi:nucleotide-binding universal stress UspA family protein
MDTFRRLFVAIDFSPSSNEALRRAHERAASTGAGLAVCHIVPNELRSNILFPHISRIAALKLPLEVTRIAEAAATRVSEITGRSKEEFELIIDDGTPQAMIVNIAEQWGADLIIMGSHGESSAANVLLGSVTNSVIRHAHCPVLIVRPGEPTRRIVAGTDFSDPGLPVIKAAAGEATRTGSQLTVVHSLDLASSPSSYPTMAFGGAPLTLSSEQIKELEQIAAQQLKDALKKLDAVGDVVVTMGPAGAALINLASAHKADLIVVGTIGRTGLSRALLGSVAETVAVGSPCSVLVVRRYPA